jgi:hypothetical protein
LFDLFRLRKGRGFASAVPDLEIMMRHSCFCTRILRHCGANVCVSDNYGKNNEYYLFKFVLREVLYYLNGVVADTIFQGFLDGMQRGVFGTMRGRFHAQTVLPAGHRGHTGSRCSTQSF